MKQRILIINTGGTIAMAPSPNGLAPKSHHLDADIKRIAAQTQADAFEYDLLEYNPVLDSCNLTPHNWLAIARDVKKHQNTYDGIVLLHGTDTMAYTASFLALALGHLSCPVIITGSQKPMSANPTDAHNNLSLALQLVLHSRVNEVCICFDDVLLRGCLSTKVSAERWHAFDSPNSRPLWQKGEAFDLLARQSNLEQTGLLNIEAASQQAPNDFPRIGVMTLLSGQSIDDHDIQWACSYNALILKSFGAGNASQSDGFHRLLNTLKTHQIPVINISQCPHGRVDMSTYETGQQLAKQGVISGADMTLEACYAKLWLLLYKNTPYCEFERHFGLSYVGELSL